METVTKILLILLVSGFSFCLSSAGRCGDDAAARAFIGKYVDEVPGFDSPVDEAHFPGSGAYILVGNKPTFRLGLQLLAHEKVVYFVLFKYPSIAGSRVGDPPIRHRIIGMIRLPKLLKGEFAMSRCYDHSNHPDRRAAIIGIATPKEHDSNEAVTPRRAWRIDTKSQTLLEIAPDSISCKPYNLYDGPEAALMSGGSPSTRAVTK